MSHNIIFDDEHYRLSIVEFNDDMTEVHIYPYIEEIASTAFVDGTVTITYADGRYGYTIG